MPRPKIDTERQAHILEALEACVARNGIAKTTLSNVAEEAGLPRSLVRYFVGNRDDMILMLFDRIIDRGEEELENSLGGHANPKMSNYLDFLFDGLFLDETSNKVLSELSYLAERNETVREKLRDLYHTACLKIADKLKAHKLGRTDAARYDAAYAIFCLCYSHATFEEVGLAPRSPKKLRKVAEHIIEQLGPSG